MAEKFDAQHADRLENPERLIELPPAKLVELLRLAGAETVVDFGAGTGMYAIPLAAAVPAGRVLAVDEQPELLDRLRAKLASHPDAGVETVLSVGGLVPLDDGVADRMLIVNVLHHVDDDPAALTEIWRLLSPGGLLVAAEFARMDRPVGPPNDHVLSLDRVRALLTGLGLDELAVYAPGAIGLYHNVIVAEKPLP